MLPRTCLVWNLISHIPSVPSLEVSHAINIRAIAMKFTRSTLNDPKYTHTKNYVNRERLSHKLWYWTKTAITFGEECICILSPLFPDLDFVPVSLVGGKLPPNGRCWINPEVIWTATCVVAWNVLDKMGLSWHTHCWQHTLSTRNTFRRCLLEVISDISPNCFQANFPPWTPDKLWYLFTQQRRIFEAHISTNKKLFMAWLKNFFVVECRFVFTLLATRN